MLSINITQLSSGVSISIYNMQNVHGEHKSHSCRFDCINAIDINGQLEDAKIIYMKIIDR
jgi:hypothetical protein